MIYGVLVTVTFIPPANSVHGNYRKTVLSYTVYSYIPMLKLGLKVEELLS